MISEKSHKNVSVYLHFSKNNPDMSISMSVYLIRNVNFQIKQVVNLKKTSISIISHNEKHVNTFRKFREKYMNTTVIQRPSLSVAMQIRCQSRLCYATSVAAFVIHYRFEHFTIIRQKINMRLSHCRMRVTPPKCLQALTCAAVQHS